MVRDQAYDDAASTRGTAEGLRPFLASKDVVVVHKEVGESACAQPFLQRYRCRIVFARMADKQNRMRPLADNVGLWVDNGRTRRHAARWQLWVLAV